MQKKKSKIKRDPLMKEQDIQELSNQFVAEITNNPKYNLQIDPENIYNFSNLEKQFIRYYIEFKSVLSAGELCGLDESGPRMIFLKIPIQEEIRRLNVAIAQEQFKTKIANLDDLGGYLTSLLTGENVPIADQLKTNDKLKVVDQLMRLNEMKRNLILDSDSYKVIDFDEQLKDLSVETIKNLLNANDMNLSRNEIKMIESLPVKETINLINDFSKGENNEQTN